MTNTLLWLLALTLGITVAALAVEAVRSEDTPPAPVDHPAAPSEADPDEQDLLDTITAGWTEADPVEDRTAEDIA